MEGNLKNVLQEVAMNGAAVAGIEMLKLHDMIQGSSPLIYYGKMGLIWTAADETVLFLRTGTSHLLAGNYFHVADQLVLNTSLIAVVDKSGLADKVVEASANLPFGNEFNGIIATGALKVGVKSAWDLLAPMTNGTVLQYIAHPTSLLRG